MFLFHTPRMSIKRRRSSYLTLTLLIVLQLKIMVAEGRSFPRFRSVRFPSESEEEEHHENTNSKGNKYEHAYQSLGRQSVLPSNNIPVSPSWPPEVDRDFSSESISVESVGDAVEITANKDLKESEAHIYDEELRKALCPPTLSGDGDSLKERNNATGRTTGVVNGKLLRYDLQVGKCAEVGKREHCGKNMLFVADKESGAYGYCECDYENKLQTREGKLADGLRGLYIPYVFRQDLNSCFRLYEQAYCKDGEWLILSREVKGPLCEERKCPLSSLATTHPRKSENKENSSTRRRTSKLLTPSFWTDEGSTAKIIAVPESAKDWNKNLENGTMSKSGTSKPNEEDRILWVPFNGTERCVQLNKRNSEYCEADEQVVFNVGDVVPKCGVLGRAIEGRATIIRNACPPGSFYSIIGRCQPDWDF